MGHAHANGSGHPNQPVQGKRENQPLQGLWESILKKGYIVKHTTSFGRAFRSALLTSAVAAIAFPAFAQQQQAAKEDKLEEIVVTGSRIARANDVSASPIAVVSFEQLTSHSDITIDAYLNTLPQVTPSGTSTSNNPGNGGQSNISLRGLGSNRNLVTLNCAHAVEAASVRNTKPRSRFMALRCRTGGRV